MNGSESETAGEKKLKTAERFRNERRTRKGTLNDQVKQTEKRKKK